MTLVCGVPHQRAAKTFPRILHYAHEGLISFEKAIEMMSDRDVRTLSKLDQGTIRVGQAADLTVFDSTSVMDTAENATPRYHPLGSHAHWSTASFCDSAFDTYQ
jgi:N-acyl-D-aspartate/D-glutamate deacylase